ncbi:AAA family ATPase [Myxosarcina sp. GI1(2024)]
MGFKRDADKPLECDAIVVDECSTVDLFMAHSLLKAIPEDAFMLMVGNIDRYTNSTILALPVRDAIAM